MFIATKFEIIGSISNLISIEISKVQRAFALFCCLVIVGCGGGGGSTDTGTTTVSETVKLVGSVGDGPIIGATITAKDANGKVITSTTSSNSAAYEISVPGNTSFPVTIIASGGTDIVSGMTPDFEMVTVALKKADINSKKRTININPFSTFIVYMAQSMNGGLTSENIAAAKQTIYDTFSFGLDAASIADPISTDIDDINIAGMVKASESMGEMIRRTRNAMITSGSNVDGDYVLTKLANDLADGKLDAMGSNTVSAISATAKIVSAQVLIETIRNQLKVNGSNATSLLDSAILTSQPTSSMSTADVSLTNKVLTQTQTALAAVERFAPGAEVSNLYSIVSGLSSNVTAADVNTTLAIDSETILNTAINLAPMATDQELASINNDSSTTPAVEAVAPVINSNPGLTADEGVAYSYDVNASDANAGDSLTYSLTTAPAGMTINASTGLISWTPDSSQVGTQNVTVLVTDDSSSALSANQGFSIAVSAVNSTANNTAPVISSNAILTAKEGIAYSYDVNATDANTGDALTYSLAAAPSGMMINATTGLVSWTPSSSHVGTQNVTVTVSDNGSPALSASQGFSIAVTAANVAPVITSSASLTAKQGDIYSYNVNATDANSADSLTYSLSSAPTGMSINASNGIINWTPSASHVGTQNVTVRVADNGTPSKSASQSFTITVAAYNGTVIRVNAGGGNYTDSMGQVWAADYGYNLGAQSTRTDAINGTVDDTLYQSERWHSGWQDTTTPELEYSFSVPSGDYALKLHFAEISASVNRIFDVEVEGTLAIDDLDIVSEAGRYTVLVRNIVTTVNDGTLNIRFPRNAKSPKISAIEILPVKNRTSAATTNSNSISTLIPEASLGTGTLTIISQPENGSASINGYNINYTPDVSFGGQDTVIYMFVDANGSVIISTITVTVTCVSCTKEATVALSWQANSETISGYRVYYGPDAENATVLISDLTVISGLFDPTAPAIEYAATSDLNFYPGETVCFKIQAYKDTQNSAMSGAICGTI